MVGHEQVRIVACIWPRVNAHSLIIQKHKPSTLMKQIKPKYSKHE